MLALAQANSYPTLPEPPAFEYYFLESPWQLLALLSLSGLILLYQANQVRSKRFLYWGAGAIALALFLLVIALAFTTPRERLIAQTRKLIDHTVPLDANRLTPFLTPECAFYSGPNDTIAKLTLRQVESFVQGKVVDIIDSQTIARMDVSIDSPTTGRTQLWLKTYIKSPLMSDQSLPASTRWELEWELVDGVWKVNSVRLIERD